MNVISRIRKLFLYAGVEKEQYKQSIPNINEENRVLLRVFSRLGCMIYFLLFIVSTFSGGFVSVNSSTYLTCSIAMLAIILCVRFSLPKYPLLVIVLVYLFEILLFAFSIHISMLHADKPAVSAVAFLLVSPLLFYDRPVRLCALIGADVAVVCVIVHCFKQPGVAETDVWNMVTFGVVAAATTMFIMSIKIRALAQSRQIEYMSQTDLMTGVKNRNHYERQLQKYPEKCRSNLACVYGDVNGLHELNYKDGHKAGDRMLMEVAKTMQKSFGPEHTYRVGGDEFVAFRMDSQPGRVSSDVDRMRQELGKKGYNVSFGIAVREKAQGMLNMDDLVKEAEYNMFSDKRDFYRQPDNNRRDIHM